MTLVVGLNPAIDVIMRVSGPSLGQLNRSLETAVYPAGKATNLVRNLGLRDVRSVLLGFVGRPDLDRFTTWLAASDVTSCLVPLEGLTRINLKVIDADTGGDTEFNSPGISVSRTNILEIENEFKRLLKEASVLILTGSLPPEAPNDIYARWIQKAKRARLPTFLDASGPPLLQGLQAVPWLVKLNWSELSQWMNVDNLDLNGAVEALRGQVSAGTEIALVTRSDLVLMVTSNGIWKAIPPSVSTRNPIGAGDALLAGMAHAWHQNAALPDMLRQATTGAVASVISMEPGGWNQEVYEELLPQVDVEVL